MSYMYVVERPVRCARAKPQMEIIDEPVQALPTDLYDDT